MAELLAGYEISGLPVVDHGDHLVGVISETDLVRLHSAAIPWTGWHGLIVRDLMTCPALTIDAGATLDDAARLMIDLGVHRLVVVDEDRAPDRRHLAERPRARDRRRLRRLLTCLDRYRAGLRRQARRTEVDADVLDA